jgi:hypothetical protein
MSEVQRVPLEWIPRTWPLVAPFIADSVAFAADGLTEDEVRVHLFDGRWVLFVAVEQGTIRGASVVSIFNRCKDRVAFVAAVGGRFLSDQDTFSQFSDQLRALGATALEGAARESVARLWARCGFVEKHRIIGVSL